MATPSWLYISQLTGNSGTTRITVSADTNYNFYSLITDVFVETDNTGLQGDTVIVQKASGDSSDSYANDYLTFQILSDGYINWKTKENGLPESISYSKNGSSWNLYIPAKGDNHIPVSRGDILKIKNYYFKYGGMTNYNTFSGSTAKFNLCGNIMSMVYEDNFSGVTSLPASTSGYNFDHLFEGCTGLTNANNLVLPVTTTKNYSYAYLFNGCTNLKRPPTLPATNLGKGCYQGMFEGCTNLIKPPIISATTLADNCYKEMFAGCTSLVVAPELPVTTLAASCYSYMFSGCTSLTTAPTLPATTLGGSCYSNMFRNCTSLTTAPELPSNTLVSICYEEMFAGCTSLVVAPELPAQTIEMKSYYGMFSGCTSLTTAPSTLGDTFHTGGFTEAKVNYGCESMFEGCTSLVSAPALPALTLGEYCYRRMFWGCTSLKRAPELPATSLAGGCYNAMFYKCTNLNYIKCLSTTVDSKFQNWVYQVQTNSGTFVKKAGVTWPRGYSGIPNNWTVQEV